MPVLTAMFDHLSACDYGGDLLRKYTVINYFGHLRYNISILLVSLSFITVDEIQVASYKMLGSLYTLGIDPSLTHER